MTTANTPSRGIEIDPRIRRRRIEVRRTAGRRRLRRVAVIAGLVVLLLLAVLAVLSPLFDVEKIAIDGAAATDPAEILAAAGIEQGDQMVRIDVDGATSAIEALPWVATAEIRRDYPSGVEIEVTERTPIGILRAAGTEALVDAQGRVLGPVRLGFGDLPRADIAADLPEPGLMVASTTLALLDVLSVVGDGIDGHTVLVSLASDDSIELLVDQQFVVDLGLADRVDTKVRSAATVLDQVDLTCVTLIDLRVAERPVLTRDEPCQ